MALEDSRESAPGVKLGVFTRRALQSSHCYVKIGLTTGLLPKTSVDRCLR